MMTNFKLFCVVFIIFHIANACLLSLGPGVNNPSMGFIEYYGSDHPVWMVQFLNNNFPSWILDEATFIDSKCWDINVPLGNAIKLTIHASGLTETAVLYLFDGPIVNANAMLYNLLQKAGTKFFAPQNVAKLCFVSFNKHHTGSGFQVSYEAFVPGDYHIKSQATTETDPQLSFIVYPRGGQFYGGNEKKCWNVTVPLKYRIAFSLLFADMNYPYEEDGLEIYEGISSSLIYNKISGPSGRKMFSETNMAKVCFYSNDYNNGQGFRLSYQPVERNLISQLPDAGPGDKNSIVIDCETYKDEGNNTDGRFLIYPYGKQGHSGIYVHCDMTTLGGGWIVVQRRTNDNESFARPWTDYKDGFGSAAEGGSYWLGNAALHYITSATRVVSHNSDFIESYTMLVRAYVEPPTTEAGSGQDPNVGIDSQVAYLYFNNLLIQREGFNYQITFDEKPICNNTYASDFAEMRHQPFSTKDRDNDISSSDCSNKEGGGGGWWYKNCGWVRLNGVYGQDDHNGILWSKFQNQGRVYPRYTEIMIRRSKIGICEKLAIESKSGLFDFEDLL